TPEVSIDNSDIDFVKQFTGSKPLPEDKQDDRERHLKNIRQLSFEGENAEAYFSFDESKLVFQARGAHNRGCDQIFTMDTLGRNIKRISTGKGRTTCGYWFPDGKRLLYASTHEASDLCPPEPDHTKGY